MPVQVFPTDNKVEAIKADFIENAEDALLSAWPESRYLELLQSTFSVETLPPHTIASSNGLVYSIIQAYGGHHHLRLRPEDIWFAVLTQFNLYINKHAEELRHQFVNHQGQKELRIDYNAVDRHHFDFGMFSDDMGRLLQKEINDADFRAWIMPEFTTTTPQDSVVASIIMMCSLQKYFTYTCGIICGFPSVTLLGEREDYIKLGSKLDKLASFGDEPRQFAALLRPVLSRFVRTFDDPAAMDVLNFWRRAMYLDNSVCGLSVYSGWLTAFCFWDEDGNCLYDTRPDWRGGSGGGGGNNLEYAEDARFGAWEETDARTGRAEYVHRPLRLSLDGVKYHAVDSTKIPPGFGRVPVKVDDHGEIVEAEMVAGSLGMVCSRSPSSSTAAADLDTMQPQSGWWIYAKSRDEHPDLVGLRERAKARAIPDEEVEKWVATARESGVVMTDGELDFWAESFEERQGVRGGGRSRFGSRWA